jgi:hypothetical protein
MDTSPPDNANAEKTSETSEKEENVSKDDLIEENSNEKSKTSETASSASPSDDEKLPTATDVDMEAADEDIMKALDENIKAAEEESRSCDKTQLDTKEETEVEKGCNTSESNEKTNGTIDASDAHSDVCMDGDKSDPSKSEGKNEELKEEEEKPDYSKALESLESIAQTNKRILDDPPEQKKETKIEAKSENVEHTHAQPDKKEEVPNDVKSETG